MISVLKSVAMKKLGIKGFLWKFPYNIADIVR